MSETDKIKDPPTGFLRKVLIEKALTEPKSLIERLEEKGGYKIINGEAVFVPDPESQEAGARLKELEEKREKHNIAWISLRDHNQQLLNQISRLSGIIEEVKKVLKRTVGTNEILLHDILDILNKGEK